MKRARYIILILLIMAGNEIKGDCEQVNVVANKLTLKVDNLTAQQKMNIAGLDAMFTKYGITNKYARIALLAIVGKETKWIPKSELSYNSTPNNRIVQIWPSLFGKMPDHQLTALKSDTVAFFECVYGGKYGNLKYGDGYKYRGRGYNQNTFKSAYDTLSLKTGFDLVNNPDKMNDPEVAAACYLEFIKVRFDSIPAILGVKNWNDFNDQETAINIIFRANAGWGKDISGKFHQETLNTCRIYSNYFSY